MAADGSIVHGWSSPLRLKRACSDVERKLPPPLRRPAASFIYGGASSPCGLAVIVAAGYWSTPPASLCAAPRGFGRRRQENPLDFYTKDKTNDETTGCLT